MSKWPIANINKFLVARQETPDPKKISSGEFSIVSKISFSSSRIEFRDHAKTNTNMITIMPGDLVISGINAGKGAIAIYEKKNEKPAVATIHYSAYSVDEKKADIEFLWFFFRSEVFREILRLGLPNGIKTELRPNKFLSLEIPLPPLPEQKRIINHINEIEKKLILLNKEHSRLLNLMTTLKKSFFELEYKNVDKISTFYDFKKGSFPTQKTKEGNFSFVTVSGEERTADGYDVEGPAVCVPLISATGHGHASLKRLFYKEGKFALANIISALLPKKNAGIIPEYLFYYLYTKKDDVLIPLMKGTANVSLPKERLLDIKLNYPDKQKQLRILEIVKKADYIIKNIEICESQMLCLIPSVLKKAFNGEL